MEAGSYLENFVTRNKEALLRPKAKLLSRYNLRKLRKVKKAVIWKFPFMLKGALEENFDQLHHQGCQRNFSGSKSN